MKKPTQKLFLQQVVFYPYQIFSNCNKLQLLLSQKQTKLIKQKTTIAFQLKTNKGNKNYFYNRYLSQDVRPPFTYAALIRQVPNNNSMKTINSIQQYTTIVCMEHQYAQQYVYSNRIQKKSVNTTIVYNISLQLYTKKSMNTTIVYNISSQLLS